MNDDLLNWLLNSDPWIEYGTRTELLANIARSQYGRTGKDGILARKASLPNTLHSLFTGF